MDPVSVRANSATIANVMMKMIIGNSLGTAVLIARQVPFNYHLDSYT